MHRYILTTNDIALFTSTIPTPPYRLAVLFTTAGLQLLRIYNQKMVSFIRSLVSKNQAWLYEGVTISAREIVSILNIDQQPRKTEYATGFVQISLC